MSRIRSLAAAATLAAAVSVPLAGAAFAQTNQYNCTDFNTQEEAQQQFESTSGDPSKLDEDGDGMACESLPSGAATTPESEPTQTTPPADEFIDRDCGDLTQAEAVALLAQDPSDPHRLDRDGDGLPCESVADGQDDAGVDQADEDGTAPAPVPQSGHIAVTG